MTLRVDEKADVTVMEAAVSLPPGTVYRGRLWLLDEPLTALFCSNRCPGGIILKTEIGWEKRTPKSDKIERRRCQYERCPSRKIHEGIPPGSSEAGNGREAIIAGGSPPVVPGAIDVRVLGEGTKGRQTGRCRQDVQALD